MSNSIISRVLHNMADPACPKRCDTGQRLSDALSSASQSTDMILQGAYSRAVAELTEHYHNCPECSAYMEFLKSN